MRRLLITLVSDTGGQDLIEYALLAGLISLMAVTAVINVGGGVTVVWGGVDTQMQAVPSP
jgi:Flp pilus assembly pilin Flp